MGERIREARKQKGLTQAELASLIGVQRAVISKYETNMIEPSIKQLKKIADALDVSIGYLQGYESIDTFQIVQALKNNNLDEIEKLAKLPKGTLDETSPKNRELIKEFAKKATESLLRSSTVEVSLVNEHVENSKRKTDVIVGLMIAVAGGTLIEKLHMEPYVEEFVRAAGGVDIESPTLTKRERIQYTREQVISTFKKVFPYILVGVGIGAIIHNWIPESWIEAVLGGNNPFGVVLATLVGIPMYADIFGTIPVAEALLYKGAQLGTILSFMMAVTTLSLPSLIMLRKAVKPKLLALFIGICTIGIILVGYLFNAFQFLLI